MAQGFAQKPGIDCGETFNPVVRFQSLRMMIALAVQNSLKLHQTDVTTAFLKETLKEEVYMRQPQGFVAEEQKKFSEQAKTKHSWSETVVSLLELYIRYPHKQNGVCTNNQQSMSVHVFRRTYVYGKSSC